MTASGAGALRRQPWRPWARQVWAVALLELRRSLTGRSGVTLYGLALAPLAVFAMWAMSTDGPRRLSQSGAFPTVFAALFQAFLLRSIVFFGCMAVFANLFRRDILDQTLHYYFLAAIRRELIVIGKYLAGLMAAGVVFTAMTGLAFALFYVPLGLGTAGSGALADGLTYMGLTALACVGYGAVFLTIGLFFTNPIVPAVVFLGWESVNFLLPPVLQRLSVAHYITQMSPVPVPESPFAIPAEAVAAPVAVPGLILVSALALALAAWRVRRLEIAYASD